ncbi:hypothetical protein [Sandaracinobacteroides hominis]|uniref:hypothetical protein n=1 Tax=Sandaracinobacteroides hominis TaxID=2780086 RepID=UPI0018F32D07|nr:hypothetical protein [Sandaracinobacteroides hominis]
MRSLAVLLTIAVTTPALAQAQTATECSKALDADLPPGFVEWTKPATAITAAANTAAVPALQPRTPATLALHPAASVKLAAAPEQLRTRPDAHAGLVSIRIPTAGNWRVALSNPAWIDLLTVAGPAKSTAHGHGPACSSIRKFVDFNLPAGEYMLQFTANPGAELRVLVSPVP